MRAEPGELLRDRGHLCPVGPNQLSRVPLCPAQLPHVRRRRGRPKGVAEHEGEYGRQCLLGAQSVETGRFGIPGLAVAVWHNGTESFAAHGVTSLENPRPVDENTLHATGSTSKPFAATALMHLVAQGKVELDAPVRRAGAARRGPAADAGPDRRDPVQHPRRRFRPVLVPQGHRRRPDGRARRLGQRAVRRLPARPRARLRDRLGGKRGPGRRPGQHRGRPLGPRALPWRG